VLAFEIPVRSRIARIPYVPRFKGYGNEGCSNAAALIFSNFYTKNVFIDVRDFHRKPGPDRSSMRRRIVKSSCRLKIGIAKGRVFYRKALLLVAVIGHGTKVLYLALNDGIASVSVRLVQRKVLAQHRAEYD
jgi:hypothetical protein